MPLSKYDLLHYDGSITVVGVKERNVFVSAECATAVGVSQEKVQLARFNAVLNANAEMIPCHFRELKVSGTALGNAQILHDYIRRVAVELDALLTLNLNKLQNEYKACEIELQSRGLLNGIKNIKVKSVLNSQANVSMRFNHVRQFIQSGLMLADVDVISIKTEQMDVDITIPAYSTLVIDMRNFTATLDGKNVYSALSGDWFAISRDTIALLIDAASGSELQGTLEYVERYL